MTPPSFHRRRATPDVVEACAAVHHASWVETYSLRTLGERHAGGSRRTVDPDPRAGDGVPFAEVEGRVVGLALVVPTRGRSPSAGAGAGAAHALSPRGPPRQRHRAGTAGCLTHSGGPP